MDLRGSCRGCDFNWIIFPRSLPCGPEQQNKLEQTASLGNPSTVKPRGEVSLQTLVKIVRPSVVQVIGYKNGKIVQTGSGFIAEGGAVVTNFHVVNGIDSAFINSVTGGKSKFWVWRITPREPT